MKLNVPLFEQQSEKGCGAAALRMVLSYYRVKKSEKEIIEKHGGLTEWGSFTVGLGLIAQDFGFRSTCYSYYLNKLEHEDFDKDKEELLRTLDSKIEEENDDFHERGLRTFKKFIRRGNKIIFDIPRISRIKNHIKNKKPVIIASNASSLFERNLELDFGHFVVVTGFKDNKMLINDPEGEIEEINEERFISSSNNVFGSSAYMLVIEEK